MRRAEAGAMTREVIKIAEDAGVTMQVASSARGEPRY